jgi:hypothetical protein
MLSGIITAHAVEIKMVRFKNMVDNDFARISEFITGNQGHPISLCFSNTGRPQKWFLFYCKTRQGFKPTP